MRATYTPRHLYLGYDNTGKFEPICRLTYAGAMHNWEFAIYKYSDDRYDPDEWFFPGMEEVDAI